MTIFYPLVEENEIIEANDQTLVDAGVIDADQVSYFEEASAKDLDWLPTED